MHPNKSTSQYFCKSQQLRSLCRKNATPIDYLYVDYLCSVSFKHSSIIMDEWLSHDLKWHTIPHHSACSYRFLFIASNHSVNEKWENSRIRRQTWRPLKKAWNSHKIPNYTVHFNILTWKMMLYWRKCKNSRLPTMKPPSMCKFCIPWNSHRNSIDNCRWKSAFAGITSGSISAPICIYNVNNLDAWMYLCPV